MRCALTTLAAILIGAALPSAGRSEDASLYDLRNITVAVFPQRDVQVLPSPDGAAALLLFRSWNADVSRVVSATFADGPFSTRVTRGLLGDAAVSVFMPDRWVTYRVKQRAGRVQVVVGERPFALLVRDMLLDPQAFSPLPGPIAALVRSGDLGAARTALATSPAKTEWERALGEARLDLLNAALAGGPPEGCAPFPSFMQKAEEMECAVLLLGCRVLRGDIGAVVRGAQRITAANDDPLLARRVARMGLQVFWQLFFEADRAGKLEEAAALLARYPAIVSTGLRTPWFFERAAAVAVAGQIPQVLRNDVEAMWGEAKDAVLLLEAPAAAEIYLESGQSVQALDVANYYGEQVRESWSRVRLARVQARAHMQRGNWRQAEAAWKVVTASPLATVEDRVLQYETTVRLGRRAAPPAVSRSDDSPGARRARWLLHLLADQVALAGGTPTDQQIERAPGFALYRAAEERREQQAADADRLLSALAERRTPWGDMARITAHIDALRARLAALEETTP